MGLRLAFEPDVVKFCVPTILLAVICLQLAEEVHNLKGRYEVVQILRAFVVAHIFRLMQFSLGRNEVPPFFYMGKVLLFYHIPITTSIAAFYIIACIFPRPSPLVGLAQILIFLITLCIPKPGMELQQDINPTQAPSSNTDLVHHQQNYDAANSSISSATNFNPSETEVIMDIQVTDHHFITILLAGLCVDLVVQLERLKRNFQLFNMFFVLAIKHIPCFMQFVLGKNKVPLVYYLRNVLLYYDIPVSAAIAGFYMIFSTSSRTLFLVLFLQFSLLSWIDKFMPKREELNQPRRLEVEQDISPTKASSLNTELLHQQNHDAADSSTLNVSQPEICDPPTGDGGFASLHDDSNRVTSDSSEEEEEEKDDDGDDSIPEITDFSRWEKVKRIGSGQYGIVYVFKHRETGELCAVKELNISENEDDESILQEVEILRKLKHHRNIVKYYGHNRDERGHICLYMEYIEQGSLYDYTKKKGKKLDEPLIQNFTAQILSGLFHLHSNRRVHRDIKPENLLVDSNETIKLVDFGLAKVLAKSVGKHSVKGTLCYAAPELLLNKDYNSLDEAYAADIWSLGCVIIEMFSGELPQWPPFDRPQLHPPIPEGLCKKGKDFLKRCFIKNPAKRPSAEELLKHHFVKSANRRSDGRKYEDW